MLFRNITRPLFRSIVGAEATIGLSSSDGVYYFGETDGTQDVTLTLADTGTVYDGAHTVTVAEQANHASGPVNEVLPAVTGTAGAGNVLTSTSGLWSFDPDDGLPAYTYQWQRDGVDISGATASTYTQTTPDEGTDVTCNVTATNTAGARTATSNAVSVPSSAFMRRVGTNFFDDNTAGTTGAWTVPLGSDAAAGDTVLLVTGPGEYVAPGDLTVDGNAATKVSTDVIGGNFGGRVSAFTYVLPVGVGSSISVATINGLTHNSRALGVVAFNGYSVTSVDEDYDGSASGMATSHSVTDSSNAVVALVIGQSGVTSVTWSGVTLVETEIPSGEIISLGTEANVATGTHNVSFTEGGAARAGLVSVLLEAV